MKATPTEAQLRHAAVEKAAIDKFIATDPDARRRAAILSAEAADVYDEMFGEQSVVLHVLVMRCLGHALIMSERLKENRKAPLAERLKAARAVARLLHAATKGMTGLHEELALLADLRAEALAIPTGRA